MEGSSLSGESRQAATNQLAWLRRQHGNPFGTAAEALPKLQTNVLPNAAPRMNEARNKKRRRVLFLVARVSPSCERPMRGAPPACSART
jgi:hypothetical protein